MKIACDLLDDVPVLDVLQLDNDWAASLIRCQHIADFPVNLELTGNQVKAPERFHVLRQEILQGVFIGETESVSISDEHRGLLALGLLLRREGSGNLGRHRDPQVIGGFGKQLGRDSFGGSGLSERHAGFQNFLGGLVDWNIDCQGRTTATLLWG